MVQQKLTSRGFTESELWIYRKPFSAFVSVYYRT